MTSTKTKLFDKELQSRAAIFKALGHPARQAILRYLSEIKTCVFGDISDELPLSSSTVTQHLKELKKIGLICGTVEGTRTNYCINPSGVKALEKIMVSLIEEINTDNPSADPDFT